ncbi:aminopeptidase N-like [Pseudomyrmex gracilis]|uniref:aminopeptidase N-like n=1 Tax=Pseudomyrmex gracilis TaxID=219809 RepID=UPI000995BB31|nr:aminopeptidase N-like [Pseudomyrmex gracilis]
MQKMISNETLLMSTVVQTRRMVFEYTQAFTEYYLIQDNSFLKNETFDKMWKERGFNIFYMMNNLFSIKNVLNDFIFEKAINLYNTSTSSRTYKEHFTLDSIWNNITFVPTIYNNMYLKNINIKNVITSWITQYDYPVVQVKRENDKQFLEIMIQDCVTVKKKNMCVYKWWIPIIYVKISRKTFTTNYVYLTSDGTSIFVANIEEDDFIVITGQNGYRVNYDRQSWENIALFLKSGKSEIWDASNLTDVTLAQILDDAFYFLIQNTKYTVPRGANIENIDIFFNLASNVVRVKNLYIVWHSVLTTLQYISKIFPLLESAKIKTKVLEILNSYLEDISHNNVSENTVSNQVYHEVLKWTCILGGLKCKEHINAILTWQFEHYIQHRLLPSWQRWIYCQGLKLKIVTKFILWLKIQNNYLLQEKLEQFFQLLPCFNFGLNYSLESLRFATYKHVTKSDSFTILFDIVARHIEDVSSLNIIINEIEHKYSPRYMSLLAVVNFSINHIYLEEDFEKIRKTVVSLFGKLIDIYNIEKAKVINDVIMKKVENRRMFVNDMKMNIRDVLHSQQTISVFDNFGADLGNRNCLQKCYNTETPPKLLAHRKKKRNNSVDKYMRVLQPKRFHICQ